MMAMRFHFFLCGLLVSSQVIFACSAPAPSSSRFLGDWKDVDSDVDRVILALLPDGSCNLSDATQELHYCRWDTGRDQKIVIHYGLFLPLNTASAKVTGDEMSLDFGSDAGKPWVLFRVGSPREQDSAAYFRGKALIESGNYEKGMAEWTLAADHGHPGAQNSLAWIFATAKDPELRDGQKAVAYAEKAASRLRHFVYLDTLAASLARNQQFEQAVQVEEEALLLLGKDESRPDREAALGRFRNRLALYKAGQPYTEP